MNWHRYGRKSLIHGDLKGRRSIAQPKRHYTKFVLTMVGAKSCFANVVLLHENLMVPLQEIELQEH